MKITHEVRAFAMEQAGRRCECTEKNCRHHLRDSRCKRGLRGDEWKVYWRTEGGGATRENIQAWCLECFANNFHAPRERVALFAADVVGHARLTEEDPWRAATLRSVLRDAAGRAAREDAGRVVFGRSGDRVLLEFATSQQAVQSARRLGPAFRDLVLRLGLTVPELCGAIHLGEAIRWRSGLLVGEAVEVTTGLLGIVGAGQIVLTAPAAEPLRGTAALTQIPDGGATGLPPVGGIWALSL